MRKKLKAIKALADRGIGGEKENAKRLYKQLSRKKKKKRKPVKPVTKEIKNARMHINKKLDAMHSDGWTKASLKTLLSEKFKIRVGKVESVDVARNMYEHLIRLTHLAKGMTYKKKRRNTKTIQ